ncbi:hypothetical protein [Symbioplanes lichenis]|uniref:hypothetical protein n=1 Tax=Symbioplanes lichenis TaxID=1629072 RepID=UPI002739BF9B|nr:hypothetical protein [Actinoplanes lichenis]
MDLIVTLTTVFTLLAGVSSYVIARRDLRAGAALAVAVVAALGTGLGFLFTVYLAVVAYVGAVGVWLVARRFLRKPGPALLVAAGVFGVGLVGSVTVMSIALSNM